MRVASSALLILVCAAPACKVYDPLYCDGPDGCTDPARPYCDLAGEYPASEGIARTCIPDPFAGDAGPGDGGDDDDGGDAGDDGSFSCEPGSFLECSDGDTAVYCDDEGTATVPVECGSECNAKEQTCTCEPETRICSGDQLIQCSAAGKVEDIITCPLGCEEIGARCFDVEPSNDLAGYLDMTADAPDVSLTNGAVINTDSGTITNGDGSTVDVPDFATGAPNGGSVRRIFIVKSLTLSDVTVTGVRAAAIVSNGDIQVRGHLRVEAGAFTTGACVGRDGVVGPEKGFSAPFSGGGGGGFASAGGPGGTATVADRVAVGAAGGVAGGNASLVPLRGGCAGGGMEDAAELGGLGGGAIQLVSRTRITVEDSSAQAYIDAGGRGGPTSLIGGTGGGSGGGILLEAPEVAITDGTAAVANGGGGAGGCGNRRGEDGTLSGTSAEGGICTSGNEFAAGGRGGALSAPPSQGNDIVNPNNASVAAGGGGGGSVGRIRINVRRPEELSAGGIVSPEPTVGVLGTR